jgi:hypothetical protein
MYRCCHPYAIARGCIPFFWLGLCLSGDAPASCCTRASFDTTELAMHLERRLLSLALARLKRLVVALLLPPEVARAARAQLSRRLHRARWPRLVNGHLDTVVLKAIASACAVSGVTCYLRDLVEAYHANCAEASPVAWARIPLPSGESVTLADLLRLDPFDFGPDGAGSTGTIMSLRGGN